MKRLMILLILPILILGGCRDKEKIRDFMKPGGMLSPRVLSVDEKTGEEKLLYLLWKPGDDQPVFPGVKIEVKISPWPGAGKLFHRAEFYIEGVKVKQQIYAAQLEKAQTTLYIDQDVTSQWAPGHRYSITAAVYNSEGQRQFLGTDLIPVQISVVPKSVLQKQLDEASKINNNDLSSDQNQPAPDIKSEKDNNQSVSTDDGLKNEQIAQLQADIEEAKAIILELQKQLADKEETLKEAQKRREGVIVVTGKSDESVTVYCKREGRLVKQFSFTFSDEKLITDFRIPIVGEEILVSAKFTLVDGQSFVLEKSTTGEWMKLSPQRMTIYFASFPYGKTIKGGK